MSEFRTKLVTQDDAYNRFVLVQPLVYASDLLFRDVVVPAGFVTDFASVPRLPFVYLMAGGCANAAAVVHDYLYVSHEVERYIADAVFEEAMAVGGEPWWRRKMMWAAVRAFGQRPYDEDASDHRRYEGLK